MGRHGIEANDIFLQEEELERLQEQQQQQQQQEEEDQKMEVDPETGGRTTDVWCCCNAWHNAHLLPAV